MPKMLTNAEVLEKTMYYFTPRGETLLHCAAKNGHLDIVGYLINDEFDIEAKNDDGYKPLHFATQEGHLDVVNLLKLVGANS
jgi:ankyrin repeat protein